MIDEEFERYEVSYYIDEGKEVIFWTDNDIKEAEKAYNYMLEVLKKRLNNTLIDCFKIHIYDYTKGVKIKSYDSKFDIS